MAEYFFGVLIAGGLLVFMTVKVIAAVDDGGEVKRTAKDGFAECFKKLFKQRRD